MLCMERREREEDVEEIAKAVDPVAWMGYCQKVLLVHSPCCFKSAWSRPCL